MLGRMYGGLKLGVRVVDRICLFSGSMDPAGSCSTASIALQVSSSLEIFLR